MHYFADSQYWSWNKDKAFFRDFAGERITIEPTGMEIDDASIHMLRSGDKLGQPNPGLSLDASTILTGKNSGYQVVNLAVLAGGNPILLVGYDMRHIDGKDHFVGGEHSIPTPENNLKGYAKNFRTMVEPLRRIGVDVINVTPGSAIDCFPRMSLEEALC